MGVKLKFHTEKKGGGRALHFNLHEQRCRKMLHNQISGWALLQLLAERRMNHVTRCIHTCMKPWLRPSGGGFPLSHYSNVRCKSSQAHVKHLVGNPPRRQISRNLLAPPQIQSFSSRHIFTVAQSVDLLCDFFFFTLHHRWYKKDVRSCGTSENKDEHQCGLGQMFGKWWCRVGHWGQPVWLQFPFLPLDAAK